MAGCLPALKGGFCLIPAATQLTPVTVAPWSGGLPERQTGLSPKLFRGQERSSGKPQAEHQVEDVSVAFDGGVSSALKPGSSGMWTCGKGAQDNVGGELLTLLRSSELR